MSQEPVLAGRSEKNHRTYQSSNVNNTNDHIPPDGIFDNIPPGPFLGEHDALNPFPESDLNFEYLPSSYNKSNVSNLSQDSIATKDFDFIQQELDNSGHSTPQKTSDSSSVTSSEDPLLLTDTNATSLLSLAPSASALPQSYCQARQLSE